MAVLTIIRRDLGRVPFEQIVGADVSDARAEWLVKSGRADWGPDVELPPAIYLLRDLRIGELVHPAGTMLHVGGELEPRQALLLIRGGHAGAPQEFPADARAAAGGVVSMPGGGVG